jgi:paired small multidrug resistance pump
VNLAWHDAAGLGGVALVLVAYLLIQTRHLDARRPSYLILNGVGAILILLSLLYAFNLSAFVIQCAWIAISGYGLLRWWRERE